MNPQHALIAAAIMHVEGAFSVKSLAFANNNPGNIRDKGGPFRIYPSKIDGFKALLDDVAANSGRPLGQFIAKYAPPNENDTAMYQSVVCSVTGLNPETPIS